jgi:hypothetical protein
VLARHVLRRHHHPEVRDRIDRDQRAIRPHGGRDEAVLIVADDNEPEHHKVAEGEDWNACLLRVTKEASAPYMQDLEEASEYYHVAAFVLWKHWTGGCIGTAVFSLNRNTFFMDWVPVYGDEKQDKEYWEKKKERRKKELDDKAFCMGLTLLRHEYKPLGLFCIERDTEEDEDGDPGQDVIWRFPWAPYTEGHSADCDFLETVARAMRYAPFAVRPSVLGDCSTQVDFWKHEGGYGFHFVE